MICVLSQSNVCHFTTKQCSTNTLRTCQTNKHIDTFLRHRLVSVQEWRWGRCPFWGGKTTLLLGRRGWDKSNQRTPVIVFVRMSTPMFRRRFGTLTQWSRSSDLIFLTLLIIFRFFVVSSTYRTNTVMTVCRRKGSRISLHSARLGSFHKFMCFLGELKVPVFEREARVELFVIFECAHSQVGVWVNLLWYLLFS